MESYKERKANYSQTLTGLGKWWGRKPLVLVRATILGLLMPTSDDPVKDREIFLKLMTMDDEGLWRRKDKSIPQARLLEELSSVPPSLCQRFLDPDAPPDEPRLRRLSGKEREELQRLVFSRMPYSEKLQYCRRPEQIDGPSPEAWQEVNAHLGTQAASLPELVEELGRRRFGHRPRVGDSFCGAGSVPFEAARLGCEAYDPNNLLRFMYQLAERTRSLLLATATPVQLRPVEAWDLLDVLGRGDEAVLGNIFSRWRRADGALDLLMGRIQPPDSENEQWEFVRNPLPPKLEHRDFEILRRRLDVPDEQAVVPGDALMRLRPQDRKRLTDLFSRFVQNHNPFIRRIVRRTREQLEKQIDPETNEPLLQPIRVELLGEDERDAILLPPYLREAYELAETFCEKLEQRMKGSGFLKTLLLRRVGSSIFAGLCTAQKLLSSWESIDEDEEDEDEFLGENDTQQAASDLSRTLTAAERELLERFVAALQANQERDPKYEVVLQCLLERDWLEPGCIIFGQIPDVLEDVWVAIALGEKERAKKIIDELPRTHPFEIRYTTVEKIDWESCSSVLETAEKLRILREAW